MTDMSPTNHTDHEHGRDQPPTDQATSLTIEEAAAVLGVSVNAVRQRIKRGTVVATRTDQGWVVDLSHQPTTDQPIVSPTDHRPTTPPAVDIAPLVEHIAELEAKVERLTEASTVWQIRARQAEEKLLAIEAGESDPEPVQETPPAAPGSTETNETPATGIRAWWRSWRDTW
jgi:hypothetical protein